jgi:two-component system sensor histidine kinase KdpD
MISATRRGYLLAALAILASTAVFILGRADFAKGQWALIYLLIVVLVASVSGPGPAVAAAILAFLAWDFFFLPPYYTFVVNDPKDYLSLAVFLGVGVLMGIQTGRMREREERAVAREHETALLNRLSARLVSQTSTATIAQTVLGEIVRVLGSSSATLFVAEDGDLRSYRAVPSGTAPDQTLKDGAERAFRGAASTASPRSAINPDAASASRDNPSLPNGGVAGVRFLPLLSPSGVTGVLAVGDLPAGRAYSPTDERLLASLANLVAAFLERQKLEAAATQAEAAREADRLKSSLLSSVSHELKTPLAALTATVSNLLEGDVAWDERSVRDELRAIIADVTRLNNSIGALLDLARLEAHAWEPRREPCDLADIITATLDALPTHQRKSIEINLPDDLPALDLDFVQWMRVFQNLLENALIYAGPPSPIRVGGESGPSGVRVWIEDSGPGIAPEEHEAVFEKFFRGHGSGPTAPSGTGLGLAITREIVRVHGASIQVEDVRPHGARFVISLPPSIAVIDKRSRQVAS